MKEELGECDSETVLCSSSCVVFTDRKRFHEAFILVTHGLVINSVFSAPPTETRLHPCSSDGHGWTDSTRPARHRPHNLLPLNCSLRRLLSSWWPYSQSSLYEWLRLEISETSRSEKCPQRIWSHPGTKTFCSDVSNPIHDESETKAATLKQTFVRNESGRFLCGFRSIRLNQNCIFILILSPPVPSFLRWWGLPPVWPESGSSGDPGWGYWTTWAGSLPVRSSDAQIQGDLLLLVSRCL